MKKRKRLGEALVEARRISPAALEKIVEEQEKQGAELGLLGELLLKRGLVSKDDLAAALEEVTC